MKIEDYIKAHRNNIDADKPDENMLWEAIREKLYHQKFRKLYNYLKIAASILLIISILTFFHLRRNVPMYQISNQLGKKERAYIEAVDQKMKEANFKQIVQTANRGIIKDMILELYYIDTLYNEALTDIEKSGYLEESVNIIFDLYELKIELLERIILETQILEDYEKNESEIEL